VFEQESQRIQANENVTPKFEEDTPISCGNGRIAMQKGKKILLIALFLCLFVSAQAMDKAISFSYGVGRPDNLTGYRASLDLEPEKAKWKWGWIYVDLNAAHWHASFDKNRTLEAVGAVPVFRLYPLGESAFITPYVELGVGVAGFNKSRIGHRKLGAYWAFEDLMGAGFMFGSKNQLDFSIRYLHYSNASLQPPNQGIDVKALFTLAYHIKQPALESQPMLAQYDQPPPTQSLQGDA
jgi:lipid A 3-O-deacylase